MCNCEFGPWAGVICLVVAIMYWLGWEMGAVEAISLSILVGSSVDYCLHLVEGYLLAGEMMLSTPGPNSVRECESESVSQQQSRAIRKTTTACFLFTHWNKLMMNIWGLIRQEAPWRLMNKEEQLVLLICVLFAAAADWEAGADPGGSEPCGRCHSVQRRHHGDLHSPPLLLCHCAFRQVRPDSGHQHRRLHSVHPDRDRGHVGEHGPRPLQQNPWRRAEGLPGCVGRCGRGSGSVLGWRTAGCVGMAINRHINATFHQIPVMSGGGLPLDAVLYFPPHWEGRSDQYTTSQHKDVRINSILRSSLSSQKTFFHLYWSVDC